MVVLGEFLAALSGGVFGGLCGVFWRRRGLWRRFLALAGSVAALSGAVGVRGGAFWRWRSLWSLCGGAFWRSDEVVLAESLVAFSGAGEVLAFAGGVAWPWRCLAEAWRGRRAFWSSLGEAVARLLWRALTGLAKVVSATAFGGLSGVWCR